jgi:hypothetical protein
MFWDDVLRHWRRGSPIASRRLLRAAAGHVATFPAPKPRPRRRLRWILIGVGIAALALLALSGRLEALLAALPA